MDKCKGVLKREENIERQSISINYFYSKLAGQIIFQATYFKQK